MRAAFLMILGLIALYACAGNSSNSTPSLITSRDTPTIVQVGPGTQHWAIWKDPSAIGPMTADHEGNV